MREDLEGGRWSPDAPGGSRSTNDTNDGPTCARVGEGARSIHSSSRRLTSPTHLHGVCGGVTLVQVEYDDDASTSDSLLHSMPKRKRVEKKGAALGEGACSTSWAPPPAEVYTGMPVPPLRADVCRVAC